MADTVRKLFGASLGAMTASLAMSGVAVVTFSTPALAQVASSGIRGDAEPQAQVTARNVNSGFTTSDVADAGGDYALQGLQPGTYDVTTTVNGQSTTRRVRVLVGQTAYLSLTAQEESEIVVVARRLDDATTSEVGTNVTREQIEGLPQPTRNFINFAALAPGVRTNTESSGEVTFSAGGQTPISVNVFIDGQSQKAQIIDGGIAGQDDSRGNPFPQLGIQEFRVLTQNFSAEYDAAGSAIITSVTRSGTNDFEAELFATYQPTEWVDYVRLGGSTAPDPETERRQYGFAIGGPIIQDRLHYFFTYEGRQDDKFTNVILGRPGYEAEFGQFQGTVAIPFEEDIFFGKLSWQPVNNQRVDFSVSYRDESDLRDVGGVDTAERATVLGFEDIKYNLRHDWQGAGGWSNVAQLDYLQTNYRNEAVNFTDFGQSFNQFRDADGVTPGFQFDINARDTVINLGGRGSRQDITQSSWSLRDDFSFPTIEAGGEHDIQIGGRVTWNNYDIVKDLDRNPFFFFDVDARPEIIGTSDIPLRVEIKSAVPDQDIDNTTYGVYIQDDWHITDRFELNLGLRWDYEDNAFNTDYRTTDEVRDLLAAYDANPGSIIFNSEDYINDGDREAFTGAWQPRLGFSWDVSPAGDESTVIFGGAGRYYDRIPYNFAYEEESSLSEFRTAINFSLDGSIPGTVAWDDAYFTAEGLQPLLDANQGQREVFLVADEIEPPVTDQFNLGIRQRLGEWRAALTLAHANTENTFSWNIGNLGPPPDGRFNGLTPTALGFPQFTNLIFYSNHNGHREFDAMYITLDRPFTEENGWGASLSYTLSRATQNGSNDQGPGAFLFDFRSTEDSPDYPSPNDERHRLVASGIVALPWDVRLSGLLTLGSGRPDFQFNPFAVNGARQNGDDFLFFGDTFVFQQLDLRLAKEFELGDGHSMELYFDVINATNHGNTTSFVNDFAASDYGEPRNQIVQGRSFQVGARARW
jgi:hypothetical protein